MLTIVSAIIPTHDRSKLLERAIRSVEAQTHNPIELIVVGSPRTPDIYEFVCGADVHSAQYIDAEAESPGAARNIGISHAEGDYLAFLDDDDEWHPTKIESQLIRLDETGAGVCHTGVTKIDSDENLRAISNPNKEGDVTRDLLVQPPYGTMSAMMVQRRLAEKVDGFDEQLTLFEDNDFNIRVSLYTTFCTVEDPLVKKHINESKHVSNNLKKMKVDASYLIEKHQQMAERMGNSVDSKMFVRIEHSIGRSAADQGHYLEAQKSFVKILTKNPTYFPGYLWLLLVIGGPLTFRTAQITKRLVVRSIALAKQATI